MKAKNIKEGTSGYSRSLPYQNYKSLFTLVEGDDEIAGGKADDLTPGDIAKKHNVKTEVIKKQLEKGKKVEMEHTNIPKLSKEISMDHLEEIPKYYDKLADMEKKALKEELRAKKVNESESINVIEILLGFFLYQALADVPLKEWPAYFAENAKSILIDFVRFANNYRYNIDAQMLEYKFDNLLQKVFKNQKSSVNESVFKAKTPGELKSNKDVIDYLRKLRNKLSNLSGYHPGDDSPYGGTVKDSRASLRSSISKIEDLILTPEQKEKKLAQQHKASEKRHVKQIKTWDEKAKMLKTITPKQKAINELINLINWRKDIKKYSNSRKEIIKLTKQIEDLKSQWDLRSYDLRRQKEYDPYYDDVNEAKKKPTSKKGKDKKFKKVMGEFGKGELKPYHAKKKLKSKKQDGSKKEHKQALAIAFSEAGMKKESVNEARNKLDIQNDPRFKQYFQVAYSELIKNGLNSEQIGEVFDDRENKNMLFVMYHQNVYPTRWLDDLDYNMIQTDIAQPFHESSSVAVGYYSGGMITPRSQKNAAKREKMEKFKKATEPEGDNGEVEEEMVHPDDKIGNMMLKKMDVPQPFYSKGNKVHQKKVDK